MKSISRFSALTIIFLFLTNVAFSQIVNIEKQRRTNTDSIYWTGHVRLGFNLIENDKTIVTINGDMRHDFHRNQHHLLSLSNYNLGRIDNSDFLNDGFQHFRYNYSISSWFIWEAFTQIQYNERINLKMRWLLGTGPRLGLLQKEKYQIFFGSMYMYEYGKELEGENSSVILRRDHRISSYLSISLQPLPNLQFQSSSYYQPVINNLDDLRLSSESTLLILITERLRFSSTFTIIYDSRVPDGVPNTTYRFSNGLRFEF